MKTDNRHCNNNHCNQRDICLWASDWRPEQPIFYGNEKDCSEFAEVKNND